MKWKTVKHYDQKTHHINREEQSWFGREKKWTISEEKYLSFWKKDRKYRSLLRKCPIIALVSAGGKQG